MASAPEQLAANINFSAFNKATELKNRIWFTLGALVIYRLGTYIPIPAVDPTIVTVITLTGGTVVRMWLGEQLPARCVGNGTSLIIIAGIVANLPHALVALLALGRTGAISTVTIIFFFAMAIGLIGFIVFMERAP